MSKNINLIICQTCKKVPFITIDNNSIDNVNINCNCGYKKRMTIGQYLEIIKKSNHISQRINRICKIHQAIYKYYCVNCKNYLCINCKEEIHNKNHNIIIIDYDCLNAENKIKECSNFLNDNFKHLYKSIINQMNKQVLILKETFNKSRSNNFKILSLISVLIRNYHYFYPNNRCYRNLKSNMFHVPKEPMGINNIDNAIEYYKSFSLLKQENILNELKPIKILTTHSNKVNSLLLLHDGRIASCSADETIAIYNAKTFEVEQIINENDSESFTYIFEDSNRNILSSSDTSIKIYALNTNNHYINYGIIRNAHEDKIKKVISIPSNRIVSCSDDGSYAVWDNKPPFTIIKRIRAHSDWISSIIFYNDYLISAAMGDDPTVKFWTINNYQLSSVITKVYCCYINALKEIDNDKLIVGEENGIKIICMKTFQIELSIHESKLGFVSSFQIIKDSIIICGCENGKLCKLNISIKKIEIINTPHRKDINSILSISDNSIATCSDDCSIIIWNY